MFLEKAGILFFMVYASTFMNLVVGLNCSEKQKARILMACHLYIMKGSVVQLPPQNGQCCLAVRKLQRPEDKQADDTMCCWTSKFRG
ncbi:hypothetical protein HU200_016679 [Digitaria exilis]|uniref:Uncharacterized protein n=1 Tax=Digitaria exilis TaxID=1010633 RepID=A0A835F8A9_9POAL|nr:hypothetical protein HU200_016679 [Digitaria exilis]